MAFQNEKNGIKCLIILIIDAGRQAHSYWGASQSALPPGRFWGPMPTLDERKIPSKFELKLICLVFIRMMHCFHRRFLIGQSSEEMNIKHFLL